jgi:hypothetical protein
MNSLESDFTNREFIKDLLETPLPRLPLSKYQLRFVQPRTEAKNIETNEDLKEETVSLCSMFVDGGGVSGIPIRQQGRIWSNDQNNASEVHFKIIPLESGGWTLEFHEKGQYLHTFNIGQDGEPGLFTSGRFTWGENWEPARDPDFYIDASHETLNRILKLALAIQRGAS